jgi:hypothetical protein
MSHITATMHAFDCMDVISVTLMTTDHDVSEESEEREWRLTTTFPGVGETDRAEWMRDLLVALLEAL